MKIFSTIFCFVVVGLWCGISSGADLKPDLRVTASQMFEAYEENEIAADENFKGKVIQINGQVREVGKTLGTAYIMLQGGGEFDVLGVQCVLDEESLKIAASIKRGQEITLIGKFDLKFGNILIKHCKVLK